MGGVRRSLPDVVGGALLLALGAAFVVGSTNYELFGEGGRIGPGFMPFVAGVLLVVFGALVGGGAAWRRGRHMQRVAGQEPETETQQGEREQDKGVGKGGSRSVLFVFGLTLAAILFIPLFGFSLSFGLLVFALATVVERERLITALVLSGGATIIPWLLFSQLLNVPLPQGLFELVSGG